MCVCVVFCLFFSARITGLQEDNKNLKLSFAKLEGERKQAQERSNNLEKVNAAVLITVPVLMCLRAHYLTNYD